MAANNIKVQIHKKGECIYDNSVSNDKNDLKSLIPNLQVLQKNINEILTGLVEGTYFIIKCVIVNYCIYIV